MIDMIRAQMRKEINGQSITQISILQYWPGIYKI